MPEGPELCKNSRFMNNVCSGRLFTGKVVKSSVSKCVDVDFASDAYTITSQSRGKELALTLQCTLEPLNKLRLLFRFGMSGKFVFGAPDEIPKHPHLKFFSRSSPSEAAGGVLCFVDARRFGSWHITPVGWGENRGPDPMFAYEAFRSNVVENLDDPAFNRPICEALLNQKYFNGIGNYLRAEILFRVGVPPFTCARKVLEPLCKERGNSESEGDILWYCHKLPLEVVTLKHKLGKSESSAITKDDYVALCQWLKCYENPSMNTAKDSNRRTIWYKGEAGGMCSASKHTIDSKRIVHMLSVCNKAQRTRRRRHHAPKHKMETKREEMVECKEGSVEFGDLLREAEMRNIGIKQEDEPRESVADEGENRSDPQDKQPAKTKRKTKLEEEPSAKKTKTSVVLSGGVRRSSKRRKQCPSLPTRRSARIKNADMRKSTTD